MLDPRETSKDGEKLTDPVKRKATFKVDTTGERIGDPESAP